MCAPPRKVSSLPLVTIRVSLGQNLFLNLYPELPRERFGVLQICIIPMCFSFELCSPLHCWLLVCLCFGLSLGLSPLLQELCSSCSAFSRAAFGNLDFWNFNFWNQLFTSPVPKPHRDPGTINEINLLLGLRQPHNTCGDSQTALFKQKLHRERLFLPFSKALE